MTASFEGGRSQLPTNSKANDYEDDLHHRLLLIVRLQRRELREPAQAVRGDYVSSPQHASCSWSRNRS